MAFKQQDVQAAIDLEQHIALETDHEKKNPEKLILMETMKKYIRNYHKRKQDQSFGDNAKKNNPNLGE